MSYKPLEGLFGYVGRHAPTLDVEGWHQSRRIEGQMAEGEEGQCYREVHVWVEADLPATTPALQTVCETIARCQRRGGRGEFRTSLRLFGPDVGGQREIRSMGVAMGWNATGNALLRPVRDLLDGTVPANHP